MQEVKLDEWKYYLLVDEWDKLVDYTHKNIQHWSSRGTYETGLLIMEFNHKINININNTYDKDFNDTHKELYFDPNRGILNTYLNFFMWEHQNSPKTAILVKDTIKLLVIEREGFEKVYKEFIKHRESFDLSIDINNFYWQMLYTQHILKMKKEGKNGR